MHVLDQPPIYGITQEKDALVITLADNKKIMLFHMKDKTPAMALGYRSEESGKWHYQHLLLDVRSAKQTNVLEPPARQLYDHGIASGYIPPHITFEEITR